MELLWLNDPQEVRVDRLYRSYTNAFPEDERRSKAQFYALFDRDQVQVYALDRAQTYVGYMICWTLGQFVFLEHFEIFPEFRYQNFGTEALSALLQRCSRVVLESEPATLNPSAARRISFYRRNGFRVVDEGYMQPAYAADKQPVPLWLMASFFSEKPGLLSEEIKDVVYQK
ncbi:GNAT family N-acetyltransferase [Bergeyella sp. RCAD1439]|uniref:GNAT family N-acetyltransferase n=1 Tax=Bergeyella anatis TaxID=3113737 RepID=UPI002E182438|nr:GNAT family N-acetyltransferase [Bergeyella sp. RCAD1439]